MKRIVLHALMAFCSVTNLNAQVNDFIKIADGKLFSSVTEPGWVKFNNNINTNPEKVFTEHPTSFGLDNGLGMRLKKTTEGQNGYKHYKFKQVYKNIDVVNGGFILHAEYNRLKSGNGKLFTPSVRNSANSISIPLAIQTAMNFINARVYAWQDFSAEQRLKKRKNDPAATYYPKPVQVYYYNENKLLLELAYECHIKTIDAGKSCICYVSAGTGEILAVLSTEYRCDFTTFPSNWYGTRDLFTNDVAVIGNSYDLEDDCQNSIYGVYNFGNSIFNTSNNQWTTDPLRSAATGLWGVKATWFHYKNFFNRNGHDNNDADIDIYHNINFGTGSVPDYNNASFQYNPAGDDIIKIGVGNTPSVLDDWNTLDIMAHEFTHGVTRYEANLVYNREPGALNESFSDIFGEFIESRVFGGCNWLIGWDRIVNGNNAPIRSMINPNNNGDPNTYQGTNWFPGAGLSVNSCTVISPPSPNQNDDCGVHTNSGVQNQMAYLLAVGGTGWNNGLTCQAPINNGYPWTVSGIGIDKMIRIAYKALTDYLGTTSNYFDARNAWVHAAVELYGSCSFEAVQTGKAWYAVGIGPPAAPGNFLCGTFGSAPLFYSKPGQVNVAQSCPVNILTTGNTVQVSSGSKVVISPGFTALNGSRFVANINNDCLYANF